MANFKKFELKQNGSDLVRPYLIIEVRRYIKGAKKWTCKLWSGWTSDRLAVDVINGSSSRDLKNKIASHPGMSEVFSNCTRIR